VKENNKVSGVLVTYNPEINILLQSLKSLSKQIYEIIIIDNNSHNIKNIQEILSFFTNITFLRLDENIGLAAAQNIALKKLTTEKNSTHAILFDQDSIIEDDFMDNMIKDELELLKSGVKVGAIGPSFFDPTTHKKYPATIYTGPFIKRVKVNSDPVEATFIIASGCLIRLNVISDVGLMKETLFVDYIDVEWCLRAKSKDYSVYISPNALMAHTIGDKRRNLFGRSISVHSPLRRYYLIRNSLYMLRLPYVPLGYKIRELVFNFLRGGTSLLFNEEKIKTLKFIFVGVYDGIRGQFGKKK